MVISIRFMEISSVICFISATISSDFTVWHHGIERLSCWVTLHPFARDSVPAHPGNNEEREGGYLD